MQSIFSTLFNIPQLPTSLISNPLLESAIPGLQATKITSGTFGTDYIATDAITTDKIATDAVTQNELAVGSVGFPEIINGSVTGGTSGELATNTVVSANVSNIDGSKHSIWHGQHRLLVDYGHLKLIRELRVPVENNPPERDWNMELRRQANWFKLKFLRHH